MKNNTIKIKAFLCLLLLMCGWVSVQAQQVLTVKGVVVDALKEPLPGASVQVVGMSTGTVTDLDGNFSLQVPKGKTIAVSFIGYVTQELTVNQNQSNLPIQLKDDSKQLNEVVVIGYGTVEKKDLTGSIQSVTSKEQIIVESRAVRVFCYFNLCTWFGGVPIVTSSTDHRPIIPKQTQDSVYRFMENELKEVIPFLPTKSERMNMTKDYGRVTKGGAEAFLARIYLEQKKWQECADLTTKLYEDNQRTREYGLEGNYADIFSLQNEGYSNSEIMWALPAAGCINGKAVSGMVLHAQLSRPKKDEEGQPDSGYFPNNYNWGDMSVKRDFYNTFDKNDKRRELLVTVFTDLKTGRLIDWLAESEWNKPIMNKYPADPSTDGSVSGNDFIIIRWADVLLMRAEALNELGDAGEAVDMVNLVRNRAGLRELDATADFGNDKKKISDHIYNERRWEFYFECQGRRTMKRFNKLVDHIARTSGDAGTNVARYLYLPFPAVAMTANPGLTQNSGYK